MGGLRRSWGDFAGDLLEPLVLLAAGATKAQAAWAGMRGIFESRVLGPLGLVAGASIGFLATTKLLVNQWKDLGMTAAAALERMTLQFRPLLGSLASAKERVKDLQKFAVKTPFEIDEIVEANKVLETLTQGALSTEKGMTLVGDAAAVTGNAFGDVATMVGRLYDGLMSGRPIGLATMRLQEMGIISGSVRNSIESMQAANASGLEIWKVMEKQLGRNKGAMDVLSLSLEGLQSTYQDTKNAMEGGFSAGFLDGQKAGIDSANKAMDALTPVLANLGEELGNADNKVEKFKAGLLNSITSWKGFSGAVEWTIKGLVGLAAVLGAASVAAIGAFTVKMLLLAAGNRTAAQSTEYLARVQSAQIPATAKLVAIKNSLQAAIRANAAGLRAEAGAQLGAAAAGAKNLLATNGMVGAVGVGRKAFGAFGLAVRFVGMQFKEMAVAMLANPMVWLMAAVAALTAVFSKMAATQRKAREEAENYSKATAGLDSGMRKQISEIRTLVDLRQAEAKILTELTGAYRDLDAAKGSEDRKRKQERVDLVKGNLKNLPSPRNLERSADELARDQAQHSGGRAVTEMERDAIAAQGPDSALQVAEERLKEIVGRRHEAFDLMREEAAAEERAAAARQEAILLESQKVALAEKEAAARNAVADAEAKLNARMHDGYAGPESVPEGVKSLMKDQLGLPEKQKALDDILARKAELESAPDSARLGELLASPSELQQIKAKIEVLDELKLATSGVAAATDKLTQFQDPENEKPAEKRDLQQELAAAKKREAAARKLAGQAGVAGIENDPRAKQDLTVRRDELQARRTEDEDPERAARAEQDRKAAELELGQARIAAESTVAGLRLKGYERERKLLEMERQKLDLRLQKDAIDGRQYDREVRALNARREALGREAAERRQELSAALVIAAARRLETEAREKGAPARAEALRKQADALEDARTRKEATKDARDVTADPAERERYVAASMAEAAAARAGERRREEEDKATGRARATAGQGTTQATLDAEILRRQGKTSEAKRTQEQAARREDELNRAEAAKRYRGMDYDAKAASGMADTDVKQTQAQRMIAELTGAGRGGPVIASSLAKIGGGGNVSGTDPDTRLLEKIARILEQVRDKDKKSVDYSPEMQP